ncbi:flippase-like domain-containing protein [Rhodobacterales bacterium FZCC0069]|nr:flippase-like domain-containing protein [Rhodobacterales bacterium FZCC0069]
MRKSKALRLIVSFAFSGLLLWLILQNVSVESVVQVLQGIRPGWLMIATVFFVAGYLCRIWRWRLMLVLENPTISLSRCSVAFMASIATNNLLPFRAGDGLRAFVFPTWLGVRTASVLASLVAERLMDLFILLLFLGCALLGLGTDPAAFLRGVEFGGLLLLVAAVAVGLLLVKPHAVEVPLQLVISLLGFWRKELAVKLSNETCRLFGVLRKLTRGRRGAHLLFWSALGWALEACVFYAVARSVPALIEPWAAWLAMPIGTLSTLLPSSPGYVGTFHYFVIAAVQALGNTEAAAAAFAVLIHFTLWFLATVWGAVSALIFIVTRHCKSRNTDEAFLRGRGA